MLSKSLRVKLTALRCCCVGLLSLDGLAVSSNVSAHLYQVMMTKLGRTLPHVFSEELLFESPGKNLLL